jgi:2-C-methyl-D-erythritol 4-phosphate cytidylyltransferase
LITAAIIVAAGTGERLGAGRPKAFVPLAGKPMVTYAVEAFSAATAIDHIVVVVPPGERDLPGLDGVVTTPGGTTRQDSVAAGLDACGSDVRVIAIHDAARPLVTPELIDRTVAALTPPWDAVAPGVAVADTLKVVDSRRAVLRTVDRTGVWTVQTPQVSTRAVLERVHARGASPADTATDDLSLIERAGGRVRLIEGDPSNFKVTHVGDLAFAAQLLEQR